MLYVILLLLVTASSSSQCIPKYAAGDYKIDIFNRSFTLFVPFKHLESPPSIIQIHGCGTLNTTEGFMIDDPSYEAKLTSMNVTASEKGWIMVYPYGKEAKPNSCSSLGDLKPLGFNAGLCCGETEDNDVSFIEAIAAHVRENMCSTSVFISGFSNGAMLSQKLACERSEVFDGFAAIEGLLVTPHCKPTRPVDILHFCGNLDYICVLGYAANIEMWREKNACELLSLQETFHSETTTCHAFNKCKDNVILEYCSIKKLSHCWSGEDDDLRLGICPQPQNKANLSATK